MNPDYQVSISGPQVCRDARGLSLRRLLQRPYQGLEERGRLFQGTVLADSPFSVTTFGEDETGELYLADYGAGDIYRVIDTVSGIPLPTAKETFDFPAVDSPAVSTDPAVLNPFGFGPVVSGAGP